MSGQTMQHVGRAVRYPLIGVGLALLEVLYRTAVPVVTVESQTSLEPGPAPAAPIGNPPPTEPLEGVS